MGRGVYWILRKLRWWELSKLDIGSCHWWWMIDDRWWIEYGRVGCDEAVGDGKSERCLMLVELELDRCWDQHPCSSVVRVSLATSKQHSQSKNQWIGWGCGVWRECQVCWCGWFHPWFRMGAHSTIVGIGRLCPIGHRQRVSWSWRGTSSCAGSHTCGDFPDHLRLQDHVVWSFFLTLRWSQSSRWARSDWVQRSTMVWVEHSSLEIWQCKGDFSTISREGIRMISEVKGTLD